MKLVGYGLLSSVPSLLYLPSIRYLASQAQSKPAPLTVGIAPAPPQFIAQLAEQRKEVRVESMRDMLPPDVNRMTPAQITEYIQLITNKCDAIILPGSRHPIDGVFTGFPRTPRDDERIHHSFLRMAAVYCAQKGEKPLMAICDGVNYLNLIHGGTCAPVTLLAMATHGQPFLAHAHGFHDIIIPKGSWQHALASKHPKSQHDEAGNAILPQVCSTHPFYQQRLPAHAVVLAYSKDLVPAIIQYSAVSIGIQDHLEQHETSSMFMGEAPCSDGTAPEEAKHPSPSNHLIHENLTVFLRATALRKEHKSVAATRPINAAIVEMLHSKEPFSYWIKRHQERQSAGATVPAH